MIVAYFSRNQKPIAWFFILVMYSGLALPLLANADAPARFSRSSANYYEKVSTLIKDPRLTAVKTIDSKSKGIERPFSPVKSIRNAAAPKKSFSSGPNQPEMQSFHSVNANNMVDLFTGDFSYNIPLLDVGGYPINIHYSSGITMDQEASWVGLGWNINPGTISRNMRGLPDDFNGTDQVEKTLSLKKNKTAGVTAGVNVELFGGSLSLGASLGVFHNNYKGWGTENGINAGLNSGSNASGSMTLGLGVTNNSQNGLDVSPSFSFKTAAEDWKTNGSGTIGTNFNSRMGVNSLQMSGQMNVQKSTIDNQKWSDQLGSFSTGISFSRPSFTPSVTIPFTSSQYAFKLKLGGLLWGLFANASVRGYASIQKIAPEDTIKLAPAFGYLYYQDANGRADALLDFNREKEMAFREKEPHIAVPMYTYDAYSISGEGTGGMFRPYRSDVGFIYDHSMTTKSNSNNFALDLGLGSYFHAGVDYDGIFANTKNGAWKGDNVLKDVVPFKQKDSIFEPVYFKNPGEKTAVDQNFYNAIGDTKLVRADLSPLYENNSSTVTATRTLSLFQNGQQSGKLPVSSELYRKQRDKRTQVISYLKASDAVNFALDKTIRSYNINSFPTSSCNNNYTNVSRVDINGALPIRKAHHLSEITVLNSDGRRYVYGVPVYNFMQRDVSFSLDQTVGGTKLYNAATGMTSYVPGQDNSTNNNRGLDNYFSRETMPSYAHNFLLSGILSPDYVDITGDGITEDDNGEAIRFNYSRVYDVNNRYSWRAPFDSAAYNDGLKTDSRDEKASYSYGEREVWYLNSVESKSMMATFVLETDSVRRDAYGVKSENGVLDSTKKSYRLREINLYSKADYIKNGPTNARPIKTVHFGYSYDLCKRNPSSRDTLGKLTLTKIWFSYNKNEKATAPNPYVFTYHSNNPNYQKGAVDRWGNFKDYRNNPGQLTNADYPYTLQSGQASNWDSTQAAANAAAWTLSKIKLPSGGELRVTYESDDYGFVQNKRATQMFSVAGFGSNAAATPSINLYQPGKDNADYQYVFINVSKAVASKDEIKRLYLDGISKIYFKLFVKMPEDRWGKGSEFVPFYADIDGENFGVKGNPSDKIIWVRLANLSDGAPPAVAAIQFLRLNLPSKAYPFSEPGDNVDAGDFIKMLQTSGGNITEMFKGYGSKARKGNYANEIAPAKSFARLDNPEFKKLGGGLRVKRIEVFDNFRAMSKQQQSDATYGQEYDYSTIRMINNVPTRISSGVAAYEPAIGGEENPFHLPVEFSEKVAPLAPTNYRYTEEPLGETYFPGAMVGYSKVRVQTINKDKKSANGFDETEFYTTYDFPTTWEFTPLDNESKKTYNPAVANFFKFFARHYVSLSQGFKVEQNDMNGKVKSQSSYAQTDLNNPISYTYNYYNVTNDASLGKRLSSSVALMDSANGTVNYNGQMGKDVEMMVDMREQISQTISASIEANLIVIAAAFFPVYTGSIIPMPSSEINRYRSLAILKVVNRYGILDSVVHIEKGSKVSTKNMVYDSETGEVVLSRTNNEFDDPVYNFVYPAHWAVSGMGPAYKNIGATWKQVNFRQGRMYTGGSTLFNTARYFESGDELYTSSQDQRAAFANPDTCAADFYSYTGEFTPKRIWAVDAAKGKENAKGIYFIDKTGAPFNATGVDITLLRSGKRNMASTPVGSVTSLSNPIRTLNGQQKIVFDASSQVITASAAQYKDFWRVDSSSYRKDTTIIVSRLADSVVGTVYYPAEALSLRREHTPGGVFSSSVTNYFTENDNYLKTYSRDPGNNSTDYFAKSWMKFDLTTGASPIPQNAVVTKALLYLRNYAGDIQHSNLRGSSSSNQTYIRQVQGGWVGSKGAGFYPNIFDEVNPSASILSPETRIKATPTGLSNRLDTADIKGIAQNMIDGFYNGWASSNQLVFGLVNSAGNNDGSTNMLTYYYPDLNGAQAHYNFRTRLELNYCKPCLDGTKPVLGSSPVPGYYCNLPKDTFICKPNIVDSAVNPYRWGILGNWRMYRAYTYYNTRKQSDSIYSINLRTDGQINAFNPYWNFGSGTALLTASTDTSRWVWNSEMTLFNRKGFEIENKDPLNRFNGGSYGYNLSMPVAVGQNTKNREMMFDGFEDYGYKTDTCISCATPRFITLNAGGTLVDTISHTGKYSLRFDGNTSADNVFKIATGAEDSLASGLSMKIDTVLRITPIVTGNGAGLNATVTAASASTNPCNTFTGSVSYTWGSGSPGGQCPADNFNISFKGMAQPRYTGNYRFYVRHDDGVIVKINGVEVLNKGGATPQYDSSSLVSMIAGKLYTIQVDYTENTGQAFINLAWKSMGGEQPFEIIPVWQLYPEGTTDASVTSTIRYDTAYCVYPRSPKPKKLTLDRFSPLQGKQMVFSAWVKEEQNCVSGSYQNSQVILNFNAGSPATVTLTPSGKIIDGWQRIEAFVTIPAAATSMTVTFKAATAGIPVYFDDVRMHPFNANIKSYVYSPVNLRLMAELDENNYATFYEYDDDGSLIRLKKETERGIKTIKETRSALQKK